MRPPSARWPRPRGSRASPRSRARRPASAASARCGARPCRSAPSRSGIRPCGRTPGSLESSVIATGALHPTNIVQRRARVIAQHRIARDHYLLTLACPPIARKVLPGQFVHVRCPGPARNLYTPLLRRPFSLYDVDRARGTIALIYKVVGLGTETLQHAKAGQSLEIIGPLGTAFTATLGLQHAVLVGGGVGIPPLYFWAKDLTRWGIEISAYLGAQTKGSVICAEAFRKLDIPTRVATDDGSAGFRGYVTACVERELTLAAGTTLYVCGPTPMMAAAASLARRWRVPAQVSLEERMGCAMGVCMGCIVEIAGPHATAHKRFQRVCTEGPVFAAER